MAINRKEQLRKAAAAVIARHGFYQSTVDLIAAEAGVSVGTLYNYFRDKNEILQHIFEVEHERRLALFAEIRQLDVPAADKLLLAIRRHLESLAEDDSAARIMLQERLIPGPCQGDVPVRARALRDFLCETAAAGLASGQLDCDPDLLATLLVGAVLALVERELLGPTARVPAEQPDYLVSGLAEIERLVRRGVVIGA